jgi:hypothetical protein
MGQVLVSGTKRGVTQALILLGAVLIVVSGVEHLHLWDIAYRHVATLGPLFVVQGIASLVLGLTLAGIRRLVVVLAGLAMMVGTIVGFVLVLTTGLFGFKLGFVSGLAYLILVVEIAAVLVLGAAGWLMLQENRPKP